MQQSSSPLVPRLLPTSEYTLPSYPFPDLLPSLLRGRSTSEVLNLVNDLGDLSARTHPINKGLCSVTAMADWLSIIKGDVEVAIYSASVDDQATEDCFLLDQLIAPVPIFKKYPVVDLLVSRNAAWSASL
ncbi:hypothetical protein M407DRAFT_27908 [Tulasnella calospora MUT 4182]|uniref:Uncharacterized protein n=1 Tax=Tulasnella calospora MUT 4182 TaxID=1051891 RepID=A0A0C3LMK3_9AGAM|nr:hypothetical protein M407DRAFT_27908 [Tulasnella calospora MUT 4182]